MNLNLSSQIFCVKKINQSGLLVLIRAITRYEPYHISASLEPISQFYCTSFAAIFSFRLYFVTMTGYKSTLINFINNNEFKLAFSCIHS